LGLLFNQYHQQLNLRYVRIQQQSGGSMSNTNTGRWLAWIVLSFMGIIVSYILLCELLPVKYTEMAELGGWVPAAVVALVFWFRVRARNRMESYRRPVQRNSQYVQPGR